MARLKKPKDQYDELCMRNDTNDGELVLFNSGKKTRLFVAGDSVHAQCLYFSGPKTLEKFARSLNQIMGVSDARPFIATAS